MTEVPLTIPSLLVFLRLTGFFAASPFPGRIAPPHARLFIAAGLAYGFSGSVPGYLPESLWAAVITEVVLGLAMGFLLAMIMHAFAYAGEVVSQQMGLRMPGFINPLDANLSLLGGAMSMLMLGFFVIGPGPLRLSFFVHRMFELVPVGSGFHVPRDMDVVLAGGAELFSSAIHVGAPLITAVFSAQLVLAVLARSVPTLNLFIEGPALTTSAGLIGLIATVNTFAPLVDRLFLRRFEQIARWFAG